MRTLSDMSINKDDDNAKNFSSINFSGLEAVKPEKIIFLKDLKRFFPKAEEVFNKEEEKIKNKIPLSNYDNLMKELNRGQTPPELDFFVGGQEDMDFQNKISNSASMNTV